MTDEQVKAYYDANGDKYSTTTIKAHHILVRTRRRRTSSGAAEAGPTSSPELAS